MSTIYKDKNQYHVVMEVAPAFWQSPETLRDIYVSTSGNITGTQSSAGAGGAFTSAASTASSAAATGGNATTITTSSNATNGKTATSAGNQASGSSSSSASSAAAVASAGASAVQNAQLNALTNSGRGGASAGSSVSTRIETMVPLSAFVHFGPGATPLAVNHQGPFVATTFSFGLPTGEPISVAQAAIQRTMTAIDVPISVHGEAAGTFQLFQSSLANEPLLLLAAIITIYIVLGILYESLIHPLTILSTLPSAGVGAVLALLIFKTDFSLIALIGVILLIGIVKKNAIILIDFAISLQREKQLDSREAIYQAAPDALSPHHDDHRGRDPGCAAAGRRIGRRLGIAPAAGHFDCGRLGAQPGADALHHAGGLSVSGPLRHPRAQCLESLVPWHHARSAACAGYAPPSSR